MKLASLQSVERDETMTLANFLLSLYHTLYGRAYATRHRPV